MQGTPPPAQPQIQYVRVAAPPINWKFVAGLTRFVGVALIGVGILVLAVDFATYFNALQNANAGTNFSSVETNWENGIVDSLYFVGFGTIVAGLGSLFKGAHKGA